MLLKYNTLSLAWALIILLLSIVAGDSANMSFSLLDKLIHVCMYGILSLLLTVGLKKQGSYPQIRFNAIWVSLTVCILYGFFIEVLQLQVPDRDFELGDILANTIGGGVGIGLFYLIYKI